jgi:hypothetical protein
MIGTPPRFLKSQNFLEYYLTEEKFDLSLLLTTITSVARLI